MSNDTLAIRLARPGIKGAAEVLFPVNDFGAPDYHKTQVVKRFIDYLQILPRQQRFLLILLFMTLQYLFPLLVPALKPFSLISTKRREKAMRRWHSSKIFALRMLADAIKASLSMIYMSHKEVILYTEEFKPTRNNSDEFEVPVRWPASMKRPSLRKNSTIRSKKKAGTEALKKKKPVVSARGKSK